MEPLDELLEGLVPWLLLDGSLLDLEEDDLSLEVLLAERSRMELEFEVEGSSVLLV